ncbi:transcriptional repressor LexA [Crocosphaera chwakensis]|uniref:SOS function regulatory protein n=1 Tax=Crocosphaera chwakensis CCY0110 TaxID=391612 RepID=A3IVZ0_9CHRO|nr:transcriptional repressor LexA [Crocosphaera chwakensis]EAZ89376.1 SOS function regulatory protein [Crocosphaera chwakensis CCY0110]
MEPLTPAQKELYDWLVHYINQNQHAPSIRQMMRAMNLRSPAPVQSRLGRMRDKGYVTWIEGKARTIKPLKVKKPGIVIKGAIAAGGLVEPFTDEQSNLELPYVLNQDDYYALRVEGNGLVENAISKRSASRCAHEDIAIIRRLAPEETVKNGEFVAANVEGYGVTLGRYTLDFSEVILTSFNKETSLKVPRTTVKIQGVVVGIWRNN